MTEHAVATPRPMPHSVTPALRGTLRRCGGRTCSRAKDEEGRTIHRQRAWESSEPDAVPPIVYQVLGSPGHPLDDGARGFMESRFGHDFSRVRVHSDIRAAESARAIDAHAYTLGNDVVFATGQYQPRTLPGLRLLAHELTHVVQQQHLPSPLQQKPVIGSHDDVYEREADRAAATLTPSLTLNSPIDQPRIRLLGSKISTDSSCKGHCSAKGTTILAGIGGLAGAIAGGLRFGWLGGILGGLAGAGLGYLIGRLSGVDVEDEAKKADAKTTDSCRKVKFNYVKGGAGPTEVFDETVEFTDVTLKCSGANPNCGGWSSKGVITLGKGACSTASCGPLASTILHEMVHDWAGWGPPYNTKDITVPGASHTTPDYLDEWAGRYIEKSCFGTNPWGLP